MPQIHCVTEDGSWDPDVLTGLVGESELAGERFLRRLVDEWRSGANRFDALGEALFVAYLEGRILGVCGLSRDPYAPGDATGRVRHLYVAAGHRRRGIGKALVLAVMEHARGVFPRLRLRTQSEAAACFYQSLGFQRCEEPEATHILNLPAG